MPSRNWPRTRISLSTASGGTGAERRFGKQAAPKMIEALRRTDRIGKLTFYFRGVWVQQHSRIADLPYMEAQVLHTGRSMIEWGPQNIENNRLIDEFMYHPCEHTIRVAVADRREALSPEPAFPRRCRIGRRRFCRRPNTAWPSINSPCRAHFVETSIPHVEAFLPLLDPASHAFGRESGQTRRPAAGARRQGGRDRAALPREAAALHRPVEFAASRNRFAKRWPPCRRQVHLP